MDRHTLGRKDKPDILILSVVSSPAMITVGLTGGIGSGKTTVSNYFRSLDIPVIDTDVIAHALLDTQEVIDSVTGLFGKQLLTIDKLLDRNKLASIIFKDKKNKVKLERVLHPRIREEVKQQTQSLANKNPPPPYIIIVVPLLFETDFQLLTDMTLAVLADESIRVERVKKRDGRDIEEINSIISHQVSDEMRRQKADDIIQNNNDINGLQSQIDELNLRYLSLAKT